MERGLTVGYQTSYEISGVVPADKEAAFDEHLVEVVGGEIDPDEPCKWYEHSEDISCAMLKSGTMEVNLHGEGENQGDVWDKEFRVVDGKVVVKEFRYQLVRDASPQEPS